MNLASIASARAVAFVELNDLNPHGRVYFPAVTSMLVEKFRFQQYPSKLEDYDEQKGVVFAQGYTGDTVIDKITLWSSVIAVDMRTSTDDSVNLLRSILEWLRDEAGVRYEPAMIKRWAYLSQLTFYSDADMDLVSPALKRLSNKLTVQMAELYQKSAEFRMASVALNFDRTVTPFAVAQFSIERRADTPYADNKYFSAAPIPTATHIKLLEEFEWDVMAETIDIK